MSNNKNIENWINVTQKKKKQKVLFNNIPLKDILKHISYKYNLNYLELKNIYIKPYIKDIVRPNSDSSSSDLSHKLEIINSKIDTLNVRNTSMLSQINPQSIQDEKIEYIFTDGSCINNGKQNAFGGVGVYFGKKDRRNYSKPQLEKPSNQKGELEAIAKALELSKSNNIIIYTDSQYSIKCINKWIHNWRKKKSDPNLWTNSKGQPVAHAKLIAHIDVLRNSKNVEFRHINSHQKEPTNKSSFQHYVWYGNSQADELAKRGSYSQR